MRENCTEATTTYECPVSSPLARQRGSSKLSLIPSELGFLASFCTLFARRLPTASGPKRLGSLFGPWFSEPPDSADSVRRFNIERERSSANALHGPTSIDAKPVQCAEFSLLAPSAPRVLPD